MSAKQDFVVGRISRTAHVVVRQPLQPVQIWSVIGAILLALQIWYTVHWILSDQFVAVPSGPDVPPEWMRMALDIGQVVMTLIWCFSFYWFVLRPWMRERRLTTDGLIMIGCTLASGWDALSDVGQYWFTYNSYLVNRGSMLGMMPITLSPHAAGACSGDRAGAASAGTSRSLGASPGSRPGAYRVARTGRPRQPGKPGSAAAYRGTG